MALRECGMAVQDDPMRLITTLAALAMFVTPAMAADWTTYENPRFGFTIETPASGWTAQPDPETGVGRTWYSDDGRSSIRLWGETIAAGAFAESAKTRMETEKAKGWTITADVGWNMDLKIAPEGWHVLTGSQDGRAMQQKSFGDYALYNTRTNR